MRPCLAIAILLISATFVRADDSCSLQIDIEGIKTVSGEIILSLTNSPKMYDPRNKIEPYKRRKIKVDEKRETVNFNEIKCGVYAIRLYHDANGNGIRDKNIFYVPKEPYGFSNNTKTVLMPPTWEESKFTVNRNSEKITIKLFNVD